MKTLICAPIKWETAEVLAAHGYYVMQMPKSSVLPWGLSFHADLQVFATKEHLFVNEEFKPLFDKKEQKQTFVQIGESYPKDCALNVKIVGRYAIFNDKCIDPQLRIQLQNEGFTEVIVNQGYAGCSICKVSDSAIITADESIYKSLKNTEIEVLKICTGNIVLDGYDTGFIGGCSFSDDQNVYFYGDINKHPDAELITDFINKHNKNVVCINNEPLNDIGGFIVLDD